MKKAMLFIIFGLVLVGLAGFLWVWSEDDSGDDAQQQLSEITDYEFEAASAEECTSVETYDAANGVCYFECESEQECNKLLSVAEQEIETYLDAYEQDSASKVEQVPQSEDEIVSDADYTVGVNETITLASGQEATEHSQVWSLIAAISPDQLTTNYIDTFRVFTSVDDDTAAYVGDDDGDGKFVIAVNLAVHNDSSPQEQTLTMVHELAHIVTLNNDQIADGTCEYETQEGCFGDQSLLARFVRQFWPAEQRERAQNEEDVYTGNESSFVTEYASTNPEEDIAESFAYYVVRSDYGGSDQASQKQAFFDQFADAVDIKQQMRDAALKQFVRARIAQ